MQPDLLLYSKQLLNLATEQVLHVPEMAPSTTYTTPHPSAENLVDLDLSLTA
jgi:hypothetical protein